MRSIVNFSPFQELHRFADMMDRMWETGQPSLGSAGTFTVPIDVWEEDNKIVVKAAIPGMDPSDIELTVDNNILTISGEFRDEKENRPENRKMYHREVRYGYFSRSISLPEDADLDKLDAEYQNGFLLVKVQRKQQHVTSPTKKIPIRNLGQGQKSLTGSQTGSQTGQSQNNPQKVGK